MLDQAQAPSDNVLENVLFELQEEIRLRNEADGTTANMSLHNIYCEILSASGQISDDDFVEVNSNHNGIYLTSFSRDLERGELSIYITQYSSDDRIEKIYKKDLERALQNYKTHFFHTIVNSIDEYDFGDPITELANEIQHQIHRYNKISFFLLTNRLYASREDIEQKSEDNKLTISFKCADLDYYRSLVSDHKLAQINIETSLPALEVVKNESFTSYIFSISGFELCAYYEKYGQRLLESNVRTYLSTRGKINKGIYNTIHSDHERHFFFAYNNGLSATASSVVFHEGQISIITDLQVVNGGQTMSTIYKAWKDKKSLRDVHVQVKLSVIHDIQNKNEFVSRISRYANTQNAIRNSDFFSNSYYHLEIKSLSNRIRVNSGNGIAKHKWFYERVRGEYLNEQLFLTKSEKTKFQLETPRHLVFDKTDLAKAYLSVAQYPNLVSKGAQLCFAHFAEKVSELYNADKNPLLDFEYKNIISQIILFRATGRLISHSHWYSGGYRAQTIAYTISLISKSISSNNLAFNWSQIWELQDINKDLSRVITKAGERVHSLLLSPPPGNSNIGTYAKTEQCWKRLGEIKLDIDFTLNCFESFGKIQEREKNNKSQVKIWTGIDAVIKVMEYANQGVPDRLLEFYNSKHAPGITEKTRGILTSWKQGKIGLPTEPQAKYIHEAILKAVEHDFRL